MNILARLAHVLEANPRRLPGVWGRGEGARDVGNHPAPTAYSLTWNIRTRMEALVPDSDAARLGAALYAGSVNPLRMGAHCGSRALNTAVTYAPIHREHPFDIGSLLSRLNVSRAPNRDENIHGRRFIPAFGATCDNRESVR